MAGERRLAAYLLLPRPYDALCKAPLALMAYGLVWVSAQDARAPVGAALVAWAAFELVLYQSRYILNDLADAELDRLHVAAVARGRLPSGSAAGRWARVAVALRVVLFGGVVVAALPSAARGPTLVAAAGFVAATAAYESARAPMRQVRPVGRGLPVIALVGAGYAVRIGFGAGLAGARGASLATLVAFGWSFGTLGVVMAWTLEAAGLRAAADATVLSRKTHIATIAALVDDVDHPLLNGRSARLTAALQAAAAAAAVAVVATLDPSLTLATLAAAAIASVVAAPIVHATWPSPRAGPAAVVLATGAAAAATTPELVLLVLTVTTTVAVARVFTPATIALDAGESVTPAQALPSR